MKATLESVRASYVLAQARLRGETGSAMYGQEFDALILELKEEVRHEEN